MREEYIHIGFSKSGSTYLQSLLTSNDDINYIYKSKRFCTEHEENKSNLFKLSNEYINIESDEHIIMPSLHPVLDVLGTRICDIHKVLKNIRVISPNAKIILIIRNHYDLIKSRYSQYIVGGGHIGFSEFTYHLNGFGNDNHDCFENYYFKIIKIIERIFGASNLLVMTFEDITKNNEYLINSFKNFSGINLGYKEKSLLNIRKGLSRRGTEIIRRINSYVVINKINKDGVIDTRIPEFYYYNLIRFIRLIDYATGSEKLSLDSKLSELIFEKFKKDNLKLSNYFNKDLSKLGYLH